MTDKPITLPPLPEPYFGEPKNEADTHLGPCFIGRDLESFARAAVLADRALNATAQGMWQPIETAPKTGRTLLLGYSNSHGRWRTLRGQWFSREIIDDEWENAEDCEEGWYETSVECDSDHSVWKTEPTHWMFTPAAPTAPIPAVDAVAGEPVARMASDSDETGDLTAAYMAGVERGRELANPSKEPRAWIDVRAERQRQVSAEGWTPQHDDEHSQGEMALAAAVYAVTKGPRDTVPPAWPWDSEWFKPKDWRRNLVRAGALILAEIERLDRESDRKSRHAAAAPWLE